MPSTCAAHTPASCTSSQPYSRPSTCRHTCAAPGRQARTSEPASPSACAPSRRCGSASSPRESASASFIHALVKRSGLVTFVTFLCLRLRGLGLEQTRDAGNRDLDPIGPVVELIAQLVHRLL